MNYFIFMYFIIYNNYNNNNKPHGKCRKCHFKTETIQHITSSCMYLTNSDHLNSHNQICNIILNKTNNKNGV